MSLAAIVNVAKGLYWFLASAGQFGTITATFHDLADPGTSTRPQRDQDTYTGLLGLSFGLYEPQRIPDSGIIQSAKGFQSVKIPFEFHLKRKPIPKELYLMDDNPVRDAIIEKYWLRHQHMMEKYPMVTEKWTRKHFEQIKFPKELEFELHGTWVDGTTELPDRLVVKLYADNSFKEVTLGDMQAKNDSNGTSTIELGTSIKSLKKHQVDGPVFFDRVYNGGWYDPWKLGLKDVMIKPVRATTPDLLRFFDYEAPWNVIRGWGTDDKQSIKLVW